MQFLNEFLSSKGSGLYLYQSKVIIDNKHLSLSMSIESDIHKNINVSEFEFKCPQDMIEGLVAEHLDTVYVTCYERAEAFIRQGNFIHIK